MNRARILCCLLPLLAACPAKGPIAAGDIEHAVERKDAAALRSWFERADLPMEQREAAMRGFVKVANPQQLRAGLEPFFVDSKDMAPLAEAALSTYPQDPAVALLAWELTVKPGIPDVRLQGWANAAGHLAPEAFQKLLEERAEALPELFRGHPTELVAAVHSLGAPLERQRRRPPRKFIALELAAQEALLAPLDKPVTAKGETDFVWRTQAAAGHQDGDRCLAADAIARHAERIGGLLGESEMRKALAGALSNSCPEKQAALFGTLSGAVFADLRGIDLCGQLEAPARAKVEVLHALDDLWVLHSMSPQGGFKRVRDDVEPYANGLEGLVRTEARLAARLAAQKTLVTISGRAQGERGEFHEVALDPSCREQRFPCLARDKTARVLLRLAAPGRKLAKDEQITAIAEPTGNVVRPQTEGQREAWLGFREVADPGGDELRREKSKSIQDVRALCARYQQEIKAALPP